MDQNSIDQIFKEALYDHTTSLDKDDLWTAIESRKSKKRYWFFGVLGVVFLLLTAGGFYLYDNHSSSLTSTSIESSSDDLGVTTQLNQTTLEDEPKKVDQIISTITSEDLITQEKDVVASRQIENNKITSSQSSNNTTTADRTTLFTATKNNKETKASIQISDFKTSFIQTEVKSKSNSSAITAIEASKITVPKPQSGIFQNKALQSIESIQNLGIENTLKRKKPKLSLAKNGVECYDHKQKLQPFYLEAYSSVDYVINRLESAAQDMNYRQEREASQTQLEGYRAGLALKFLTRSGLYLKSGVEVGVIKERFDRVMIEERTEIWPKQVLEIIERNDSTIIIRGDLPVLIRDSTTFKIFNSYRTIGVPLVLGYQHKINKLTYGLEIGAVYDFYYDFKGTLLNRALVPQKVTDYFRRSRLSSLTGGISAGYDLNPKFKVLARASFKHNLGEINNVNNPVDQTNTRIGLGLGLEMKL